MALLMLIPLPIWAAGSVYCPADLHVHYEWEAGALPPPYHYQYTIDVRGNGEGSVAMIPDYATDRAPVWTERFYVNGASLEQLCERLSAEGLWTRRWETADQPLLGASRESLTVIADSRQAVIPPFPAVSLRGHAEAVYWAVKSLVPETLWEGFETRRRQYQRRHWGP